MEQLGRLTELVTATPGLRAVELRDALRREGRVSMTTADVLRTLDGDRRRFRRGPPGGTGWWPPPVASSAVSSPRAAAPLPDSAAVDRNSFETISPAGRGGLDDRSALPALYRWQRSALAAWRSAGRRGVIEAVTGAGKTVIGVTAAVQELAGGGQVVVIVPTGELLFQWHRVLADAVPANTMIGLLGMGRRDGLGQCDVVIAVVNSARDGDLAPRRPGGLLVGDECHRYASIENRRALNWGFAHRLGLSATFARPDNGHREWLEPYFGPTCYRLGYEQALADDVIAPFHVVLVGLEFSGEERAEYDHHNAEMTAAGAELIARFGVPTEPVGAFLAAVGALARTEERGGVVARMYLRAMRERRRVLDDAHSKQELIVALGPVVAAAERTLVFTSSIGAADRAAQALVGIGHAAASIHSGYDSKYRRASMDAFRDGRLSVLVAPQVLDEGIDVPSADLAVVLGATRSRRQMVQRMGRIVRRKPDGRPARFVVGYIGRTVEDPQRGAHESFLDEVTAVARRVETYSPSTDGWDGLVSLLSIDVVE